MGEGGRAIAPNPTTLDATITFALATDAPASLEVVDLARGMVHRADVGARGAGVHTFRLAQLKRLPPGGVPDPALTGEGRAHPQAGSGQVTAAGAARGLAVWGDCRSRLGAGRNIVPPLPVCAGKIVIRHSIPTRGDTPAPATVSTDSDDDAEPAPSSHLRWRSLFAASSVADLAPGCA